ncbi:MAG TPA: hypothetical protein ENK58_01675 [Desulfobacterales bacterium]|nr:hypothetical protein [Desulfobacterales bacterium]
MKQISVQSFISVVIFARKIKQILCLRMTADRRMDMTTDRRMKRIFAYPFNPEIRCHIWL